mmetsp:Transcript_26086/g.62844  ORF Transcript_26086/g.62844 Transcript_26086/m.62844 type:complete len:1178 (-) Transcript_26086:293-3826(-)
MNPDHDADGQPLPALPNLGLSADVDVDDHDADAGAEKYLEQLEKLTDGNPAHVATPEEQGSVYTETGVDASRDALDAMDPITPVPNNGTAHQPEAGESRTETKAQKKKKRKTRAERRAARERRQQKDKLEANAAMSGKDGAVRGRDKKHNKKKKHVKDKPKDTATGSAHFRPLLDRNQWLEVKGKTVRGVVETNAQGDLLLYGKLLLLVPEDRSFTKVALKLSQIRAKLMQMKPSSVLEMSATLTSWPKWSKFPLGMAKNKVTDEEKTKKRGRGSKQQDGGARERKGKSAEPKSKTNERKRKNVFEVHWDDIRLKEAEASVTVGTIRVNRKNPRKAYVSREAKDADSSGSGPLRDILIDGFMDRNRAMDGDIVAVVALGDAKAGEKKMGKKQNWRQNNSGGNNNKNEQPKGKVVAVMKRKRDASCKVTGYMRSASDGPVKDSDRIARFVPLDKRLPIALVPRSKWPEKFQSEVRLAKQLRMEEKKRIREAKEKNSGGEKLAAEGSEETKTEKKQSGGIPEDAPTMIYVGKYQTWETYQKMPFIDIVDSIGMTGNIKAETRAILDECGVDYDYDGDFEPEHLACLSPYMDDPLKGGSDSAWAIPEEEVKKRLDLRSKRICTIDPTTARDLDDALSIDRLPDGTGYRVGVHIADVTHFLKSGSALDQEAKNRATTIYLTQKSLPMLPRVLSENLCSLAPKVDRLAFSCFFTMSESGKLLKSPPPWFGKTVIRTCCQLDYKTAQKLIDADSEAVRDEKEYYEELEMPERMIPIEGVSLKEVAADLKIFNRIAMARRAHRFETGSLSLNRGKVGFALDENQMPVEMFSYTRQDSNRMIEEYMLLANLLVAEKIRSVFPDEALMRIQPPPDVPQMMDMQAFLKEMGYEVGIRTGLELHKSLSELEGQTVNGTPIRAIVELLLTKPMMLAMYECAGSDEVKRLSCKHYALNFENYTHYTSPIRRYVDVVVHRMLLHAIAREPNGQFATVGVRKHRGLNQEPPEETLYTQGVVERIAMDCNRRKKNAKEASEMSSRVYLALCLKTQPLMKTACVIDIGYKSFKVMIQEMGIDAQVYVQDIVAYKKCVVNAKGVEVDAKNEMETPKSDRFLQITWEEGMEPERIGIFGSITVRMTAKMSPPPISVKLSVVRKNTSAGSAEGKMPTEPPKQSRQLSNDPSLVSDDF